MPTPLVILMTPFLSRHAYLNKYVRRYVIHSAITWQSLIKLRIAQINRASLKPEEYNVSGIHDASSVPKYHSTQLFILRPCDAFDAYICQKRVPCISDINNRNNCVQQPKCVRHARGYWVFVCPSDLGYASSGLLLYHGFLLSVRVPFWSPFDLCFGSQLSP